MSVESTDESQGNENSPCNTGEDDSEPDQPLIPVASHPSQVRGDMWPRLVLSSRGQIRCLQGPPRRLIGFFEEDESRTLSGALVDAFLRGSDWEQTGTSGADDAPENLAADLLSEAA